MAKTFILSDASENTKGLVIPTDSIDISTFESNPVCLYMHERSMVLGRWENLRVEGGKLLAEPVFDLQDDFAKNIANKVEGNFIKAASIGIRNIKGYVALNANGEEYYHVTYCELCEVSIVSVPSNRSALVYEADGVTLMDEATLSDIINSKIKKTSMDLKAIAQKLGLPATATEAEVEAALSDLQTKGTAFDTLQANMKAQQKAKAVQLCDAAIADGRIEAAKKDTFISLADNNFELFEQTLGAIPKPQTIKQLLKNPATGTAVADSRKDWTFSDWSKKDAKGLVALEDTNKELFDQLYEAEFGVKPDADVAVTKK